MSSGITALIVIVALVIIAVVVTLAVRSRKARRHSGSIGLAPLGSLTTKGLDKQHTTAHTREATSPDSTKPSPSS